MVITTIQQFLSRHRVTNDNDYITHGSLCPKGKYNIGNDESTKSNFYRLYSEAYMDGQSLSITENPRGWALPLIIDIDIKKKVNPSESDKEQEPLYTQKHIEGMIQSIFDILSRLFVFGENEEDFENEEDHKEIPRENFLCCVLERDGYIKTNKLGEQIFSNGFHLHFPKIILNRTDVKTVLIPEVIAHMRRNDIPIPQIFKYNYDILFDTSVYENKPWFLFGSTKIEDTASPYLLTKIYTYDNRLPPNFDLDDEAQNTPIVKKEGWDSFFQHLRDIPILYTKKGERQTDLNFLKSCLPEIFSILDVENRLDLYSVCRRNMDFNNEEYTSSFNVDKFAESILNECNFNNDNVYEQQDVEDDEHHNHTREVLKKSNSTVFFKNLMRLLPENYQDDYNHWMLIGWITYNHFNGSYVGFEIWDEWSQLSPTKYSHDVNRRTWDKMKKSELSIGTLRYLARKYAPAQYENLCEQFCDNLIKKMMQNMTGTHSEFAELLYYLYKDSFVCASIEKNIWFQFKNHCWQQIDGGFSFERKFLRRWSRNLMC